MEHVEDDQHSKEDAKGCMINLKVKLDVKMTKSGRRIAKKRTKGKGAAGTGEHCVHWTGWHRTTMCAPDRAPPYIGVNRNYYLPVNFQEMHACFVIILDLIYIYTYTF